ncbi:MAG: hypothetical protein K8T20_00350 [Planctomycetes bacterium]|nr:hypothetical protein [Planctomycetota bacterium]
MPLLNFPCPTCGAMVSTVDLAPGVTPFCSGCGRTFPDASPAIPANYSSPGNATSAGLGGIVVAVIMVVMLVGGAGFYLTAKRSETMRSTLESARAQSQAQQANAVRVRQLAAQLEDPDFDKSIAAWHGLYGCDRADHDGTFAILDELYARTSARNALWNLTNGYQEYYGQPGETAISRELVARQRVQDQVDLLCQSLESCPESVTREVNPAKGAEGWVKSARILEAASARIDRPLASQRIRQALEKVRSQIPAEKR